MIKDKLSKLIDKSQEKLSAEPRNYIGASIIGSECLRQIWYEYKGFKGDSIPSQTKRTWDIGKNLELLIINWLMDAKVTIKLDGKTYSAHGMNYFQGHVDAIISVNNQDAILEIKTANDASFNAFKNKGLKNWYPTYFAQVQSYMGLTGINNVYILVLNKNNSLISDELVTFDKEFYEALVNKARTIHSAESEPPRISGSPLWYQCKMCKFHKICHNL